jgi:hypothetical protein
MLAHYMNAVSQSVGFCAGSAATPTVAVSIEYFAGH